MWTHLKGLNMILHRNHSITSVKKSKGERTKQSSLTNYNPKRLNGARVMARTPEMFNKP